MPGQKPSSFVARGALRLLPAALFLFGTPESPAAARLYTFEIPDRLPAAYQVAFDVSHPGKVAVEARWSGGRVLSFRLEGPSSAVLHLQRSGPSPQRIETTVADGSAAIGGTWRLFVRALPGRGGAQVDLSIELPDLNPPPAPVKPAPAAELGVSEKELDLEPWARPATPPATAAPALRGLFDAVERFRGAVVGPSGEFASDPCSWHSEFLARAAALRDATAAGALPIAPGDRNGIARFAAAVRRVDELRSSQDPLLAGPVPTDARERIVWRARRGDRIRPLEEDLDALLSDVRSGKCFPGLTGDLWPPRFAACMIACERYFEERVRIGDEAANAELAKSEWDRYLDAARILEALAESPGRGEVSTPLTESTRP